MASIGALGAAISVCGQELRPTPGIWARVGAVVRSGYGVRFHDVSPVLPGGAGNFANGFVLGSVSTNSPNTWNWGYDGSTPPHMPGGSAITGTDLNLYRYDQQPRVGSVDAGSGSTFGGELRAGFEALRFEVFGRDIRFGLEAGYSFASLSVNGSGSVTGAGSYTTGTYSLIGPGGQVIQAPQAPYAGTFNGPGPLIPLAPTSLNTIQGVGTSVAEFSLDADLHTLKFGPYFELPLSRRWVVGLSFGYCTVLPDAQFGIRENTSFPGSDIPGSSLSQTVRKSDWQPGGYAELRVNFELHRRVALFLAGEFQHNEDLSFDGFGRQAVVEMGGIFGASGGVRLSF
jgi:hypothetical protein